MKKVTTVCAGLAMAFTAMAAPASAYTSNSTSVLHFAPEAIAVTPRRDRGLFRLVTSKAHQHGVPPALAHGIVRVESGYNCRAYNRSGQAFGIMQVKQATAHGVGVHGDLLQCEVGIEAGMRYLKQALNKAMGNWGIAARYYNAGLGATARYTSYSRKVLRGR